MKKILLLNTILAPILTLLSYYHNNAGECCDLIFEAGWPKAFYGGSGGFLGNTQNTVFWSDLIIDLAFWFTTGFLLSLLVQLLFRKFASRPSAK